MSVQNELFTVAKASRASGLNDGTIRSWFSDEFNPLPFTQTTINGKSYRMVTLEDVWECMQVRGIPYVPPPPFPPGQPPMLAPDDAEVRLTSVTDRLSALVEHLGYFLPPLSQKPEEDIPQPNIDIF
jgi:hypothetical protein